MPLIVLSFLDSSIENRDKNLSKYFNQAHLSFSFFSLKNIQGK